MNPEQYHLGFHEDKVGTLPVLTWPTHILRTGMTQSAASQQFGVTQPRISDLMRGKIDLFSIDTLVNMLPAAGLHVDLRIRQAS